MCKTVFLSWTERTKPKSLVLFSIKHNISNKKVNYYDITL